jgi:hypothetical protein
VCYLAFAYTDWRRLWKTCWDLNRVHPNTNQVRYCYTVAFSEWLQCYDVNLFICICGQDHHLPPPLLPNTVSNSITGCSYLSPRVSPTVVVPPPLPIRLCQRCVKREITSKSSPVPPSRMKAFPAATDRQPTCQLFLPDTCADPPDPLLSALRAWLNATHREMLVKT